MRLTRIVWRAHHPRWSFAPTSGEGAACYGGQFDQIGVPALYTSLRLETAWLEAQQGLPFKAQPMTLCDYGVDCEDIADLTNSATRATLGIDLSDLGCAWEDLADQGTNPPSSGSRRPPDRHRARRHPGAEFRCRRHRSRCQRRVLAVVDRSPASGRSHRRHRPAAAERSLLAVTPVDRPRRGIRDGHETRPTGKNLNVDCLTGFFARESLYSSHYLGPRDMNGKTHEFALQIIPI